MLWGSLQGTGEDGFCLLGASMLCFLGGKIGRQPALLFDEIGADWDSTTLLNFISVAQLEGKSGNLEQLGV